MASSNAAPLTKEDFLRELQHYATKEDLANLRADLFKWMAGLLAGMVLVGIAAAASFAIQLFSLL